MNMKKQMLAYILILALLLAQAACAEPAAALTADQPAEAFTTCVHNGRVTLVDGAIVDTPVTGFEDAAAVVDSVIDQLGGDENTFLEPWRELTDAFGNRYYVFQQMFDNTTVLGGAVKVITDEAGDMLGMTSSIEANPSDVEVSEGITGEEAEQIVLDNAPAARQQTLTVMEGLTERMILPIALSVSLEDEDTEGSRYVWVVYTDNPDSSVTQGSDLPYLAHYVALTGEYLYSLPTIRPGDEAGASGFDASYVFEFMEPADYTGYVDLSTGEEMEISVTVMRDKRTGMYYLGNLERRIVVADCWEFLFGGNRVVLEASPDNLEWDQVGLLTFYNYCRAYDYYREIGWIGGDGLGTPIMVLNNYCDINHKPVNNAAYVGGYMGWQMFLASQGNDLSQCLDVLAHEFTHCVTGSVMTYNAYKNDYGAINEAMSDIQGKTCEMMMEGRENVSWLLGDMGAEAIRSMDDPHRFMQPEFTWDVFYTPNVKTPTLLNDEGGVHTNSSLLNHVAYRLYENGGMTLEEGRAFWFTVDCAMVPGTDYPQLSELLPWALRAAGLEKYDAELRRALDATRLGVNDIPETFDEDRALLTLHLPENALFDDEQWVMMVLSVDIERLIGTVRDIVGKVIAGDYSVLPQFAQKLLGWEETKTHEPSGENRNLFSVLVDVFIGNGEEAAEETPEAAGQSGEGDILEELSEWVREHLKDTVYAASTNGGQDGHTMRIVGIPGFTLPVLMHGVFNETTSDLEESSILVYIGGRWVDIGKLMKEVETAEAGNPEDASEAPLDENLEALVDRIIENMDNFKKLDDVLEMFLFRVEGGVENVVPADGLDVIEPVMSTLSLSDLEGDIEPAQPRKSRPKIEAEETLPDAA